jgi:Transposase IS116/IS110/IS902 family
MIQQLAKLRGVGVQSATVLVREGFVREFANGKALGSYAGLTATPYSSGGTEREQGIGKAGNARLRTLMVELAWLWQRYQPNSTQLSWFRERVSGTGRRMRKVMVVALARKLLIALWRFATQGVVPEGAVMKPAPQSIPKAESESHDGPGTRIQGGVAVVRPGAFASSQRVVPPSWNSPVPNAGPWWGLSPAGCEVCREDLC